MISSEDLNILKESIRSVTPYYSSPMVERLVESYEEAIRRINFHISLDLKRTEEAWQMETNQRESIKEIQDEMQYLLVIIWDTRSLLLDVKGKKKRNVSRKSILKKINEYILKKEAGSYFHVNSRDPGRTIPEL